MACSGACSNVCRAPLPTSMVGRPPSRAGANATTEGTRFRPSSPGITTGLSPCMKATRELVVPRWIPTMRSVDILQFVNLVIEYLESLSREPENNYSITRLHNCSIFQHFVHIPYQIPD